MAFHALSTLLKVAIEGCRRRNVVISVCLEIILGECAVYLQIKCYTNMKHRKRFSSTSYKVYILHLFLKYGWQWVGLGSVRIGLSAHKVSI